MISKGSRNLKQKEDKVAFMEESKTLSNVVNRLHKERVSIKASLKEILCNTIQKHFSIIEKTV